MITLCALQGQTLSKVEGSTEGLSNTLFSLTPEVCFSGLSAVVLVLNKMKLPGKQVAKSFTEILCLLLCLFFQRGREVHAETRTMKSTEKF